MERIVALGGQEYTVRRLPIGKALAWRKRANAVVNALGPIVEAYEQEHDEAKLIRAASALLTTADGALEEMLECVLSASSGLAADRQHILETAYDDELLAAFEEVLLLNAPLAGAAHSITAPRGDFSATT